MSKFGYWYPPGAANDPNAPYNQTDENVCEVCALPIDDCVCPKCPVCGGQGDPHCYDEIDDSDYNDYGRIFMGSMSHGGHGLVRSLGQVVLKADAEARWEAEAKAEDEAEAEYLAERDHYASGYSRTADRIDGYDRDDLGESPDY